MRVLAACSLGGAGHLQPLRPILDAARRAGHDTLLIGPPALTDLAADTGHPFAPGAEPPEAEVDAIRERLPVVPAGEASVLANRELFGRLATRAMLPAMVRVVETWQPDLVVRDPCEYSSAVVAHRTGHRIAQVAIGLAAAEWGSIEVAAPALEKHRPGLTDAVRATPYVTRFPASLDPSPFASTRRFREHPAIVHRPRGGPPTGTGSGRPLVYVSFGTVLGHMSIAAEAYRTVLDAVAGIDARVLLSVGRRFEPSRLGAVPGNVRIEPWFDQRDVLAEAELVVCHGGSGTTFGALAAGVPVVIVPLFADQFANAATVVDAGAGLAVEAGNEVDGGRRRLRPGDAARIAGAIETVRGDRSFRDAARRIGDEMAGAPAVGELVADLLGRS